MNLPILLSKKYRFLALTAFFILLGLGCSHENAQNVEEKTDEAKTEGEETADTETTEEATTEVQSSAETNSSSSSITASSSPTTSANTSVISAPSTSSSVSTGSFCPSNFIFSCMVKGTQPETNTEEACRAVYGVPTCKPASPSISYCPSGMVLYCPSAYADKMPTAPTFQACYAALSTNTYANCKEPQDIRSTSCVSDGTNKLCVGYVVPATTTTTTTSTSTTSSTSVTSPTSTTSTSSTSTSTSEPSSTTTTSLSPGSRGKGKK